MGAGSQVSSASASGIEVLGSLRLVQMRFRFQVLEPLRLPPYKGSTFRGVLGKALKRTLCLRRGLPDCQGCRLMEVCRYPDLFETRFSLRRKSGQAVPPPPFVLIPPQAADTDFQAGELLECGLVLVGDAADDASAFIGAFAEAGRIGLGRERVPCRLESVEALSPGDGSEGTLQRRGGIVELSGKKVIRDRSGWIGTRRWRLEFLSPVRLQCNGRLVKTADFRVLVQRLSERLQALVGLYGEGGCLDFPAILEEASRVRLVEARLRWDDWERYSNRQKTRMRLGGFRGSASYEGDLDFFVPLLAIGEWLNVGKGATFGLGRFRVAAEGELE
ncbi:MAG: CRISPR system precrRNA processing endoribonuclease RAMP protein Cas6 [Acidobacteriota bacterium]